MTVKSGVPGWERLLARLAARAERRVDRLKERVARDRPAIVTPYRGWGTPRELVVSGRVLRDPGLSAREDERVWRNLLDMAHRIESDEVPGAKVEATFGATRVVAEADEEGFFEARLEVSEVPADRLWHAVHLRVVSPPSMPAAIASAPVLVPLAGTEMAVVSDLDDTVVRTGATSILRMARTVLLGSARTRVPFPGVAAFYEALHVGRTGRPTNPIFYVSSSPWNLYDVLSGFLGLQGIPLGPIVLRDWGIREDELLPTRHRAHKEQAIRRLLDRWPHLPFVLVGDSGQEDPEIYAALVREYPGRIRAVYIRDVVRQPGRSQALSRLAEEVLAAGSSLVVVEDTLAAAVHAAQHGWIEPAAVDRVAGRRAVDAPARAGRESPVTVVEPPGGPPGP